MNIGNPGNFKNEHLEMVIQTRRDFIITASAATAGAVINPQIIVGGNTSAAKTNPICVFTKCLQFLDYDRLGETLAKVGFKNVELSVRKGGHVLPQNVQTDLPKAIKALQKSGVGVPMMVTDIIDADNAETDLVLKTASELGIKNYRMGYIRYNPKISVPENLDINKVTFEKLENANRKYEIVGAYQNHSGTNIGGPVWDLYSLLKDRNPQFIGCQYDIRHAVCEGGVSWPLGMKLLSPWIKTIAIKDFYWEKKNGKWGITNVPLGEGMVDFDAYFKQYNSLGISVPVSIHYEYDLGGAQSGSKNPTMSLEKISGFLKNDLNWLKKKLSDHGILSSMI